MLEAERQRFNYLINGTTEGNEGVGERRDEGGSSLTETKRLITADRQTVLYLTDFRPL